MIEKAIQEQINKSLPDLSALKEQIKEMHSLIKALSIPDRQKRPYPNDLLNINQVCERVSFSHDWVYRNMKEGKFPKQVDGLPVARWKSHDIDDWIENLNYREKPRVIKNLEGKKEGKQNA